jgi:hypothetical protein
VLAEPAPDNGALGRAVDRVRDAAWPRSVERYRKELKLDTRLFPMFGENRLEHLGLRLLAAGSDASRR